METYYVYFMQNLLDPAKAYIGMTKKEGENFEKYKSGDKDLREDIKKYGLKNFPKIKLCAFSSYKEAHYFEGFYIRTLKTHISNGGYNKDFAGGGYCPMTEKHKNKIKNTWAQKINKPDNAADKNPMYKKSVYDVWKFEYGEKKANKMWDEKCKKTSNSMRGSKQTKVTCPFCNKTGGISAMIRYHFDNCKMK